MSERNRRNDDPTRLIVVVCTILFAVGIGVGVTLWVNKLSRDNARQYEPQEYSEQPGGVCFKLEPLISLCPPEQRDSRGEAQRADDDLMAQQEMADWAFAVALISAAGFFLSLVGVVLIWATFSATRRQVKEAVAANELTKQRDFADQRPWIIVDQIRVPTLSIGHDEGVYEFSVDVEAEAKNTGKTPALRVELHAKLTVATERPFMETESELDSFCEKCCRTTTLGRSIALFPNVPRRTLHDTAKRRDLDPENPPAIMWLYVCVTYVSNADKSRVMHTGIAAHLEVERTSGPIDPMHPNRVKNVHLRDYRNIYSIG